MATEKLTAFNADIQRYIERPRKAEKTAIMHDIKDRTLYEGINFNRLFPKGSKRYKVLDTIVYLLSVGGICTITGDKLADKVGVSERTVHQTVNYIKQTGLFIVGGLADGKNKYVFVYKGHADFSEIMAAVFYVNPAEIETESEEIAEHNAEQIAELPNAETVGAQEVEGDKTDSIYSISNIFKQEKDTKTAIRQSVENDITKDNQDDKAAEYLTNPLQQRLYEQIIADSLLHADIKRKAVIIALRAGSNLDEKRYNKATAAVRKIDKHLTLGGEVTSIPALFEKLYGDRIKYDRYYSEKESQPQKVARDMSVYFDWLNS